MMHKIKQVPEDFVVKEKSSVNFGKEGEYSYFLMGKRDYTTVKAIETIAKSAHAKSKDLGFAGSKDRRAITEQVISFRGSEKRLEGLKLNDIELKFLGKGSKPVSLGDLEGNNFEIVVRNITDSPKPINKITNFFGEQRFSKQNVDVGKVLLVPQAQNREQLLDKSLLVSQMCKQTGYRFGQRIHILLYDGQPGT